MFESCWKGREKEKKLDYFEKKLDYYILLNY